MENILSKSLYGLGTLFVLFAIFGFVMTFGPVAYFEIAYRFYQMGNAIHVITDPIAHMRQGQYFASDFTSTQFHYPKIIPVDTDFGIVIPKIGANAKVTANVDPSNPNIYLSVLKRSVAHAKGSMLPDQTGTVYLFAHSTDNFWDVGLYNAVFYLLKELQTGDSVDVYYQGKEYVYAITQTKIVDPKDIGYLVNSNKTDKQLILQTCWPPGTTWKRLLVIAKPS